MPLTKLLTFISGIVTAILIAGCTAMSTTPPVKETSQTQAQLQPRDLKSEYAALAQTGGRSYALDPAKSTVRIYAFRGGRAPRLGHNHVLAAPQFLGYFFLPPGGAAGGRFDLEFRLDQLELDNPAYRAGVGGAFSTELSADQIAATRTHMLSAENMQAEQFPFVRLHSVAIVGEAPKFAAKVGIEMHGQTRDMWIPLDVQGLPDKLVVSGALVLRQSDFGIRPYSVLGGLLAMQDEVVVEFQLTGN